MRNNLPKLITFVALLAAIAIVSAGCFWGGPWRGHGRGDFHGDFHGDRGR